LFEKMNQFSKKFGSNLWVQTYRELFPFSFRLDPFVFGFPDFLAFDLWSNPFMFENKKSKLAKHQT